MRYRKLGKTNIEVSEIGLGGIPLQKITKEETKNLIQYLAKTGVNFIDTARGYQKSEALIGEALNELGIRENFFIATKSMARTYQAMKEDIEKSLHDLKTSYIDLYQMHNVSKISDFQTLMSEEGGYRALLEAKEKNIIKHIGLTSHNIDFVSSIINDYPFETLQFPYNIVEEQAENVFKKAKQNDIGVIVMKPLGGGAIDNAPLALKFILQNENITTVIPGMASIKEAEINTKDYGKILTDEEKEEIKKIKTTLGNDFCRRCGYCMPCTVGINIPNCFLFAGYYTRYNLQEWGITRYNGQTVKAKDCIECGECMKRCPYHLDIIKKLKEVSKIFD